MRRAVWALLIGVTAIGLLFLFVLPGQTWLQQRRDLRTSSASLHALNATNAQLGRRIKALKNDQTIGNMAREQYGLVKPGQKAYVIIPPSSGSSGSGSGSSGSVGSGSGGSGSGGSGSGSSPSRQLASGTTSRRPASASGGSFWRRLEFWN